MVDITTTEFQFHKGTIKTGIINAFRAVGDINFNSIKVQLKLVGITGSDVHS